MPDLKAKTLAASSEGRIKVFTDPYASPTGFPFKVLQAVGTVSEQDVFEGRARICDLGYLRQSYRQDDGTLGYRCPGEPLEDYLRKGGSRARDSRPQMRVQRAGRGRRLCTGSTERRN